MRKCLLAGIAGLILLIACTNGRHGKRVNEITKISFATGGCFGTCPFRAIEVDSSLNFKYYGGRYADPHGYYTGRMSRVLWDSLNILLEGIGFRELDTLYDRTRDDEETESIVFYGQERKSILAHRRSLPSSVDRVLDWIMDSYTKVNLTPSEDSLPFLTKLQYPRIPPYRND